MKTKTIVLLFLVLAVGVDCYAQTFRLGDALERGVANYERIKSKNSIISAAGENTRLQKQQYLPELTLSAQQSYGTINVQHGPMYAYGGLSSAATSMPMAEQSWNAAFGSLYFVNVNWNLFTFGRLKSQVRSGQRKEAVASADLDQEIFQHQVRITAAYLNLLASQRLHFIQGENLKRAEVFFEITDTRAQSGLIPEVDAKLAEAEVSNAKSLQIKAFDKELEYSRQLAVLLNEEFRIYELDSLYSTTIPSRDVYGSGNGTAQHPMLKLQKSKVEESVQAELTIRTGQLPTLSVFGVLQGRGSGFDWNYAQDNSAYSSSYFDGVGIDRGNYLLGLSLTWNITNFYRSGTKAREQRFLTDALQHDLNLIETEISAQEKMAALQLENSYKNLDETKTQLAAAQLAYTQHTALYQNGLTNIVDYTQSLFFLNRAEIDHEIAQNGVWQALLLLASARGDMGIIINQNLD